MNEFVKTEQQREVLALAPKEGLLDEAIPDLARLRNFYWNSAASWDRGFRAGLWAGFAAAMLTLGAGVAFVMWIGGMG